MNNRTRITNDKFSVRICQIADTYGFKTLGSLRKFLKQCKPTAKIGLGTGHVRALQLLKEVETEVDIDYYRTCDNDLCHELD